MIGRLLNLSHVSWRTSRTSVAGGQKPGENPRDNFLCPGAHTPSGCQTVFVSRVAIMRSRPGSAVQSLTGSRTTRLRFSAAASLQMEATLTLQMQPYRRRVVVHARRPES